METAMNYLPIMHVSAPLNEKTWGRGCVVLVVKTKNGGYFPRFKSTKYRRNYS